MSITRAVAVVLRGRTILVIKRYLRLRRPEPCPMCSGRGPCPGHHYAVLPGGGVEPGETVQAAALRELHEETTMRARIGRLLWTGTHNGRPAVYFLMDDVTGEPALSGPEAREHGPDNSFELLWAAPEELAALGLHPPGLVAALTGLVAP